MTTSMGFAEGFLGLQAAMNRGKPIKHFDWKKAARIILDEKPQSAEAGLDGDFNCTCATIYRDGAHVQGEGYSCYHGSSNWATPTIVLHYEDGKNKEIECYAEGDADPHIWWPEDAVAVLNKSKVKRAKAMRTKKAGAR